MRQGLFDLHPALKACVCLPLPSRSLKAVEKYVGFRRQLAANGEWAIAQYLRAAEQYDPDAAWQALQNILRYNEEDLDATWAVYCWLRDTASS